MTYQPPQQLLGALSYQKAGCYGMPHINAWYANRNINSHRYDHEAYCAVCGKPNTNAHHEPFRGLGGGSSRFTLHGVELRPALIGLCGSGTTGCHGARHNRQVDFEWVWDTDEYAEMWWTGRFFEDGLQPHDPILYAFGFWKITDKRRGITFEYRERV